MAERPRAALARKSNRALWGSLEKVFDGLMAEGAAVGLPVASEVDVVDVRFGVTSVKGDGGFTGA